MAERKCGVEIFEKRTRKVVRFINCAGKSRRAIDKVEDGVNINLNHAEFCTQVVGLDEDC